MNLRRGQSGFNGQSPRAYIGDSIERSRAVASASGELLKLWKSLLIHAVESDSVELLMALSHGEFTGRIYYEVYCPYGQHSNTKDEKAHELVAQFNDLISQEPLCFIASRYLTMLHLMHELHNRHIEPS